MKRLLILFAALLSMQANAQRFDQLPPITGAEVSAGNDKIMILDVSAPHPQARTMTLSELLNVPGMFTAKANVDGGNSWTGPQAFGGNVTLNSNTTNNGTATLGGSLIFPTGVAVTMQGGAAATWRTALGGLAAVNPGTGVATALGVNIGTNGAPIVRGGDAGTPSSINLANSTGLPASQVTTALRYTPADQRQLRERVVANRVTINTGVTSTTAIQAETTAITYTITDDARDFRMVYVSPANANPLSLKASVLVAGTGTIYPVFFNGARTTTVSPGATLTSDPVSISLAKGATLQVRTFVDAGSGQVIKTNFANLEHGSTSQHWSGGTDYTDNASPPSAAGGGHIFAPNLIVGRSLNPCLGLIGDSIMAYGVGTQEGWARQYYGTYASYGYLGAGKLGNVLQFAVGGLTAQDYTLQWQRLGLFKYLDYAIVNLGANDLTNSRSEAQIKSDLQAIWAMLDRAGVKVWICTITPRSSSSDVYATEANQTAQYTSIITPLNTYFRTIPSPAIGCIDLSDAVSTARDSGKWKPLYTSEGLHPLAVAVDAMTAVMPADVTTR